MELRKSLFVKEKIERTQAVLYDFKDIWILEEYSPLTARPKIVLWIPVIAIAVIGFALYIPELLGFRLGLSYTEKTSIILTSAITLFAAIEGYSTYMQVELENKKNMIEDARNELEKAYGPLYTLLNTFHFKSDKQKEFYLGNNEKIHVDEILATYPFMFPPEIYDLWLKKIQNLSPSLDVDTFTTKDYTIPFEFRDRINEEYGRRVKKYNELLKK